MSVSVYRLTACAIIPVAVPARGLMTICNCHDVNKLESQQVSNAERGKAWMSMNHRGIMFEYTIVGHSFEITS